VVILAVLGTHEQPFPRAIVQAASLREDGERLVVQHGHTAPPATIDAEYRRWVPRAELDELCRRARVVVVHGGSGCIFQALRNGAVPIVIPRLARHGEHVDDHQLQLCTRLDDGGRVIAWHEGVPAAEVLRRWAARAPAATAAHADCRPVIWATARALAAQAGGGRRRPAIRLRGRAAGLRA
jgi:UDP-N-acetylglucosamine transferase subunit ALG13